MIDVRIFLNESFRVCQNRSLVSCGTKAEIFELSRATAN